MVANEVNRMKTAKEMFEELGYGQTKTDYYIEYCKYLRPFCNCIIFNTHQKEYECKTDDDYYLILDVDEHKAIHQQLKELGWLDE